ncbi:MAG: hypothetical protein LBL00_07255 [Endomicrobium sp.]|jgi:hypothetical protein|nr:hypothetical protein [Endomicrobium sp.]
MKKIRNFKVNLRTREIIRVIKKLTNAAEMDVETEEFVQRACHFYSGFVAPSVVYDTFSKDTVSFVYEKDAPSKWIARSVFFITIGTKLEEEFKKNESAFGEHSKTIVSAIAVDALEQAKNFTQRLIAAEAADENCDISRSAEIPADLYEEAAKVVPADKIDISVIEGKLSPQYSTCGLFYWTPSGKRKARK